MNIALTLTKRRLSSLISTMPNDLTTTRKISTSELSELWVTSYSYSMSLPTLTMLLGNACPHMVSTRVLPHHFTLETEKDNFFWMKRVREWRKVLQRHDLLDVEAWKMIQLALPSREGAFILKSPILYPTHPYKYFQYADSYGSGSCLSFLFIYNSGYQN